MSTDLTPRDLTSMVLDRIRELGDAGAATYFDASVSTIKAWRSGRNAPPIAALQRVWDESILCQSPETWGALPTETMALLLPMYETLEPVTFYTMVKAMKQYGMEKIRILPKWRTLIVEARNDLAEKALLTPSEWFVYGDADSVLPCGSVATMTKHGCAMPTEKAARNAFVRLMSHPKDKLIVGALYKDRRGGHRAQAESAFVSPAENARLLGCYSGATKTEGLEKQGWIGFGLVRIHRSVFERMKEAAKPGGVLEDIAPPPGREKEPHGFFHTTRQQRGEDVVFCRRAAKIGVDVWLDTGCLLGHLGKKVY